MSAEGFNEELINKSLTLFMRDAEKFKEEDLKNPTFHKFLRELSLNIVSFTNEKSYIKTAQFMDLFCINDQNLWINLELFTLKKSDSFTP